MKKKEKPTVRGKTQKRNTEDRGGRRFYRCWEEGGGGSGETLSYRQERINYSSLG